VVEVNGAVANDPSLVAADPYGKGWLIKIKAAPGTKLDALLTPQQYEAQIASQGH
jgi:glycine cleavage system H protein